MTQTADASVLMGRIRAVLGTVDLDCGCRAKLDAALQRFEDLERRRSLRWLIEDARRQGERIGALLDLLSEMDDVGVEESDASVFEELALLFDSIAAAATEGAEDLRRVGAAYERTRKAAAPASGGAEVTPLRPPRT